MSAVIIMMLVGSPRLLVSEIKLYNEQKVKEGRESSDLYERLREAIDRSREMYEKRVQPPVASKFDYFNYELVNTLAKGDKARARVKIIRDPLFRITSLRSAAYNFEKMREKPESSDLETFSDMSLRR